MPRDRSDGVRSVGGHLVLLRDLFALGADPDSLRQLIRPWLSHFSSTSRSGVGTGSAQPQLSHGGAIPSRCQHGNSQSFPHLHFSVPGVTPVPSRNTPSRSGIGGTSLSITTV